MTIRELITGVRHIGVYVDDMDTSIATYAKLFDLEPESLFQVPAADEPAPDSRFAFIPIGGIEFELIEPISDNFKHKVGHPPAGINHVAFTVSNIELAVELMQAKGVRLGHVTPDGILDMPRSRVAYFNREDTGGILIEFVQPNDAT